MPDNCNAIKDYSKAANTCPRVFLNFISLCMLYILQIIPLIFEFHLNSTYLFISQGIDGYRYMLKKEYQDRLQELYQHERIKYRL